jgi:gliding motility-associated-like protein
MLPLLIQAQTPTATLEANGATTFCENGLAKIKIKFTGTAPFGFKYKTTNSLGSIISSEYGPIYENDFTNGYYEYVIGELFENTTLELITLYDASVPTPWSSSAGIPQSGQTLNFYIDHPVVPNAGIDIIKQCGFQVQLNGSQPVNGNGVNWSTLSTGTFSNANINNPTFTSPAVGTVTFRYTETAGVCVRSDEVNVTFVGSPSGALSGDAIICKTGTLNAQTTLTGNGPFNYTLTDGSNSVSRINISGPNDLVPINLNGAATWQFTSLTDINNCTALAINLQGQATAIDQQPFISAGTDQNVCGLTTVLNATTDKGTGTWSATGVSFANNNDPVSNITSQNYGSQTLTWNVNNSGCINTDQVTITFFRFPDLTNFVPPANEICEGASSPTTFTLTGDGPWTLEYLEGGILKQSTFSNPLANILLSPTQTTQYQFIKLTGANQCAVNPTIQAFTIEVEEIQAADAGPDQELNRQYETLLSAQPASVPGIWEATNNYALIVSPNTPSTQIQNLLVGSNTFRWTTTPKICPSTFDELTIVVKNYKTYNGFSPNGDGINDFFVVDGVTDGTNVNSNELTVFDSRGKVVFSQKNYKNDWQGTDMSGKPLPDGSYYYVFTVSNTQPVKDYLVIKRAIPSSTN